MDASLRPQECANEKDDLSLSTKRGDVRRVRDWLNEVPVITYTPTQRPTLRGEPTSHVLLQMNSNAARKRMMDEMLSVIAWLPQRHRHEAVLILFAAGLRRLSTAEIRAARVELIHGTPPCPCGCDNRTALTEILEGHLVLRELGFVGE